jgi:uncharacterized protein YdhG (YjbR/CyaY superfamily)
VRGAPDTTTVEDYLAGLPPERQAHMRELRSLLRENLPAKFEEAVQYGMITYRVPLARYPKTYNKQPLAYVSLGNQKHHMALYGGVPAEDDAGFRAAYEATGKKLDMGVGCVRFKRLDDLPLEMLTGIWREATVDGFIALYERMRASAGRPKR